MRGDSQMTGGILRALGLSRLPSAGAEPMDCESDRRQATDSENQISHPSTPDRSAATPIHNPSVPTRCPLEPKEYARDLYCFLQGRKTGALSVEELRRALSDLCSEFDYEPVGWNTVARPFRELLADRKRYVRRGNKTVRVYFVPPIATRHPGGAASALGALLKVAA